MKSNSSYLSIKDVLNTATQYLKKRQIDNPRLTAEILLAFVLGIEREQLYINYEERLHRKEIRSYWAVIKRRIRGEPVQYITGKKEFWSLEFYVSPSVLIPRPETEILVENAIGIIKDKKNPSVLDLGTGSGVIAISIAKEVPDARIWALDISEEAIRVARDNAKKHNVFNRIKFLKGDLWAPLRHINIKFDLIAKNPPYISKEDYENMPREIKNWEPKIALNGGYKGVSIIKKIVKEAGNFLIHGGWIFIEIAPKQIDIVVELFKNTGQFHSIEGIKDYSRQFRVVKACRR